MKRLHKKNNCAVSQPQSLRCCFGRVRRTKAGIYGNAGGSVHASTGASGNAGGRTDRNDPRDLGAGGGDGRKNAGGRNLHRAS